MKEDYRNQMRFEGDGFGRRSGLLLVEAVVVVNIELEHVLISEVGGVERAADVRRISMK